MKRRGIVPKGEERVGRKREERVGRKREGV